MINYQLQMPPNEYPGKLIAFTGIKGTGKTTLIQGSVAYLKERGVEAVYTKQHNLEFYQYPIFQRYVTDENTILRGEIDITALTFISLGDTLQKLRTQLIPLLEQGIWVLMDRYVIDQVAGFSVFSSDAKGMETVRCAANLLIKPDLAFFLDVDSALAIQRVLQRDGESDNLVYDRNFYDLNNQRFLDFALANGWIILDGGGAPDEILSKTIPYLNELLPARAGRA